MPPGAITNRLKGPPPAAAPPDCRPQKRRFAHAPRTAPMRIPPLSGGIAHSIGHEHNLVALRKPSKNRPRDEQ
jgi:hypothetical protein